VGQEKIIIGQKKYLPMRMFSCSPSKTLKKKSAVPYILELRDNMASVG
jgi:hypothetical protein